MPSLAPESGPGCPQPPVSVDAGPIPTTDQGTITPVSTTACDHCGMTLVLGPAVQSGEVNLIKCPTCLNYMRLGEEAPRQGCNKGVGYCCGGALLLAAAVGVTVLTYRAGGDYYLIWIGGFILGLVYMCHGLVLCFTTGADAQGDVQADVQRQGSEPITEPVLLSFASNEAPNPMTSPRSTPEYM